MSYFQASYAVNDILTDYFGNKYKVITGGTTPTTPFDPNNIVSGNIIWGSLELQPVDTGGSSGDQGLSYWQASTSYAVDDIVVYDDKIYRCTTAHTSTSNFDSSKWTEISASGSSGGGIDSTTLALLHFDGNYNDECNISWVSSGSGVSIDTSEKKFGSGSLRVSNSSYLTSIHNNRFNFGDDDFTIECWFNIDNPSSGNQTIFSSYTDYKIGVFCAGATLRYLFSSNGSSWNILIGDGGGANGVGSVTITTGWHHFAYVRSGTTIYGFVDGQLDFQKTDVLVGVVNRVEPLCLGRWGANTYFMTGYIDEFRVSNIARYTSTFTPPSAPFDYNSNSGGGGV